MKTKWLLTFAIAAVGVAGAAKMKSYEITFDRPAVIGSVQLPAGQYSMKVDATTIHFKNIETGKTADATGKLATATEKFDGTGSISENSNGSLKVKEIDLGGTTTKIQFE
jgi:hypothetical protein